MAGIAHAVIVGVGIAVAGGIVGTLIFGLYLSVMSHFGFLTNNGYAALGIEDYKGFSTLQADQGRQDACALHCH